MKRKWREFAKTIVHFRDGLVERIDRGRKRCAVHRDISLGGARMKLGMFGATFLLALREIRRHLLRSFLTTLGIIIGVAAVITMVTLGRGLTANVQEEISGARFRRVHRLSRAQSIANTAPPPFDDADVRAVRKPDRR